MRKDYSFTPPHEIQEQTTNQLISKTGQELNFTAMHLWPEENNSRLKENIIKLAHLKEVTWDLISPCWERAENTSNNKRNTIESAQRKIKIYFAYARMHHYAALSALKEKKEMQALALISHSIYHLGRLNGYNIYFKKHISIIEKSGKGGKGKAAKTKHTIQYLKELLEKPLNNGWRNEIDTTKKLSAEIDKFILEHNYGSAVIDSEKLIIDAISEKGEVRDTYLANLKETETKK